MKKVIGCLFIISLIFLFIWDIVEVLDYLIRHDPINLIPVIVSIPIFSIFLLGMQRAAKELKEERDSEINRTKGKWSEILSEMQKRNTK